MVVCWLRLGSMFFVMQGLSLPGPPALSFGLSTGNAFMFSGGFSVHDLSTYSLCPRMFSNF